MTLLRTATLTLVVMLLLAGCTSIFNSTPAATPTPTQPPPTPTPTPEPAAAILNGERILLADYQDELIRLQMALEAKGMTLTPQEQSQKVLDQMVDQLLLAQGAAEAGITVTDAELDERIQALTEEMGGGTALADWQTKYHYSANSFRRLLRVSVLGMKMRDQIINGVPEEVEQIHARQIRVDDEAKIQSLYQNLLAGGEFETLAFQEDPLTGGDLLWFPRGYLLQPAVEEAAFALQPGQFSAPVQTDIGWHIVYVVARELHQLTPDARLALQKKALQDWLEERRSQSTLEVTIP